MRAIAIVSTLLWSSLAAFAADVSGAWAISIETPNGTLEATLTMKQDGDKLTGSVTSQLGDSPIAGTVKENGVEFTMTLEANGQSRALKYSGKIDGDKIAGSIDVGGQGELKFSGTKKS
jgi:hypothetical protein